MGAGSWAIISTPESKASSSSTSSTAIGRPSVHLADGAHWAAGQRRGAALRTVFRTVYAGSIPFARPILCPARTRPGSVICDLLGMASCCRPPVRRQGAPPRHRRPPSPCCQDSAQTDGQRRDAEGVCHRSVSVGRHVLTDERGAHGIMVPFRAAEDQSVWSVGCKIFRCATSSRTGKRDVTYAPKGIGAPSCMLPQLC